MATTKKRLRRLRRKEQQAQAEAEDWQGVYEEDCRGKRRRRIKVIHPKWQTSEARGVRGGRTGWAGLGSLRPSIQVKKAKRRGEVDKIGRGERGEEFDKGAKRIEILRKLRNGEG